ncbi:MAG: murein transglycosylase A [Alphaproteobacteria bacterium]|nr:murein transglycosylase A [Alphaproteobacteria bacterium]MCB1550443.1 murein transglycosylase A [Alphaproteobacteria bacterium]MCB9985534.1 murein transglycosylase A [Micavibrio sp.]HPQ50711.1 MltA domain-containing protein [Alphaproteobacteria bacterium]
MSVFFRISMIFLFLMPVLLGLSGCASVPSQSEKATMPELDLKLVSFNQIDGWHDDLQQKALMPLYLSCEKILKGDSKKTFGIKPEMGNYGDWQDMCRHIPNWELSTVEEARAFFEAWFVPYLLSDKEKTEGLFTGYYEPTLYGSLTRTDRFSIPLRSRPQDLVMVNLGDFREELKGQRIAGRVLGGQLKPYEDRAAIEDGKLPDQVDTALVWVDSAIDAFFLQIQGSGVVVLPDDTVMRVGYDGQNGHIYTAIGKELIARGALTKDNVSMQTIKAWLIAHPKEGRDVMRLNQSYVFFRALKTDGSVGAQGVVLSPERSLAIDPVFLPYGAPIFLDIGHPDGSDSSIRSLVVAQDTGGAIKGPVRGDLFWGYGDHAGAMAGVMKSKGQAWILLPKKVVK